MKEIKPIQKFGKLLLAATLATTLCCTAAFAAGKSDTGPLHADPADAFVSIVQDDGAALEDATVPEGDVVTADIPAPDKEDTTAADAEQGVTSDTNEGENAIAEDEETVQDDSSRTKYIITGVVILVVGVCGYAALHVKSKKGA